MPSKAIESKIYRDARTLICSEYANVIPTILNCVGEASFTKLFLIAYLIRQCNNRPGLVYDGRHSRHLFQKALIQSVGTIDMLMLEFESAITACRVLITSGRIIQSDTSFLLPETTNEKSSGMSLSAFSGKLLTECEELSDTYMLEELLRHVRN